jgi:hypothetical protein
LRRLRKTNLRKGCLGRDSVALLVLLIGIGLVVVLSI